MYDRKVISALLEFFPRRSLVLDVNKADQVMSNYQYGTWYIGGHSMGGASAGMYASAHPDQIDGLFLVAAYTTKPVTADENMIVLSVYGDHDGVLSLHRVEECRQNATEAQYHEVIIPGGNHGQFGDYGMQTGDHIATITAEEQRAQTIRAWVQWM